MMKQFLKQCRQEIEAFLKAYGADAMSEIVIFRNVWNFLAASTGSAIICGFMGAQFHWMAGVLGLFAGSFGPAALLWLSDRRDNDIVLKDLKWLYETITVQLQAGLHIHQALQESEALMRNKRLRKALHTLTEQLMLGQDMTAALTNFEESFHNRYINSFSLILRQMQDSGYAVKLLEDIRLQMEEMERTQLIRKKETLEMQLQMFQMLLFIGILALVINGCILAAFESIRVI